MIARTCVTVLVLVAALAAAENLHETPRGIDTGELNRQADPCDDFHEFANGAWRAANPIPPSLQRWSPRIAAHDANKQQLREILDEVSARRDWLHGSIEQLLSDHYASCLDEAAIDAAGLSPLTGLLGQIDSIKDATDVQRVIRKLHDIAVPVAFAVNGDLDNETPLDFIANIGASGAGLPDRDDYLKSDARLVEERSKYQSHIARLLQLSGVPDAEASSAAADILELERTLAEASLDSAAADPAKAYHKMSFVQLAALTPHLDWKTYFDAAKLPRTALNVAEPELLQQIDKQIVAAPLATWRMYLRWRLLDSASPYLSKAFVEESFAFNDAYLKGATEMPSRAMRCVESTQAVLGEPLGRKYIERHFPPAAKEKAQEIARALLAVLKEDVAHIAWMQPQTKLQALEKLSTYNAQLGYPDRWKDYSHVAMGRGMYWADVVAGRRFNVDDNRRRIGKPTQRNLWRLSASSPDAYLDLQLNEIVIPAGFLQPPTFDPGASDAVNYGSFGIGLAHDMTHSIDTLGAELDSLGRPRNWWTDTDRERFQQRGACVADQYEGYFIEPGVHHNGKLVLGESIGDLTGARIAYEALERSMTAHPVPTLDGFTPQQQFFIAWGQFRGDAMRIEAQRKLVKDDPHPTPRFRVNGPLANLPQFQQAFACKADAGMVRAPEKRCSVW